MKKIAFYNQKGGTGKTTLCVQMARIMAHMGYKMLVLDMDGQTNAQNALGVHEVERSIFEILDYRYPMDPEEAIIHISENLDLITNTNIDIINADLYRASRIDNFFEKKLKALENFYDFMFIDCSPTQSRINQAILYYCDEILVPVQLEAFSLQGAASIFALLDELEISKEKVKYIIPNLFDRRTNNSKGNLKVVTDFFVQYSYIKISEPIYKRIKINEANEKSISVQDYDQDALNEILKAIKVVV